MFNPQSEKDLQFNCQNLLITIWALQTRKNVYMGFELRFKMESYDTRFLE